MRCAPPAVTQMLELLVGVDLTDVCVLFLLEGGEGLEEFGQVNIRVATGGQGFLWHFLQPPIRFFFFVQILQAFWRGKKERKRRLAPPEIPRSLQQSQY